MNQLHAENLHSQFKGRVVVDNISISVASGEIVGLLGPNGAGKTTCFYMLTGLIHSNKGTITLDGENITRMPTHQRAKHGIGYLPQEPSIFRGLSVEQNILVSLEARKNLHKDQYRPLCDALLSGLQIAHLRDNKGASLSGGERKRAEIARALALQPKFILLDEPFAGVDPISVKEIQQILQQLCKQGIGLLLTDHNVRETLSICTRVYILNEGQMLAEGAPNHILENQQVRDIYLGSDFSL